MTETAFVVGDRVTVRRHSHGLHARILAIAEGYALLRYPRCSVFVESLRDLTKVAS